MKVVRNIRNNRGFMIVVVDNRPSDEQLIVDLFGNGETKGHANITNDGYVLDTRTGQKVGSVFIETDRLKADVIVFFVSLHGEGKFCNLDQFTDPQLRFQNRRTIPAKSVRDVDSLILSPSLYFNKSAHELIKSLQKSSVELIGEPLTATQLGYIFDSELGVLTNYLQAMPLLQDIEEARDPHTLIVSHAFVVVDEFTRVFVEMRLFNKNEIVEEAMVTMVLKENLQPKTES